MWLYLAAIALGAWLGLGAAESPLSRTALLFLSVAVVLRVLVLALTTLLQP